MHVKASAAKKAKTTLVIWHQNSRTKKSIRSFLWILKGMFKMKIMMRKLTSSIWNPIILRRTRKALFIWGRKWFLRSIGDQVAITERIDLLWTTWVRIRDRKNCRSSSLRVSRLDTTQRTFNILMRSKMTGTLLPRGCKMPKMLRDQVMVSGLEVEHCEKHSKGETQVRQTYWYRGSPINNNSSK